MTWKDIISKRALRPTTSADRQLPQNIAQQKENYVDGQYVPPAPNLPETPQVKTSKFNDVSVKILNELNSSISGNFGNKGLSKLQQSGLIENIKKYLRELRDVIS